LYNKITKVLYLAREHLGVSDDVWNELASNVDVIYHNGALVHWLKPYHTLKGPNVMGTLRVIELAMTTKLKIINHISTTR